MYIAQFESDHTDMPCIRFGSMGGGSVRYNYSYMARIRAIGENSAGFMPGIYSFLLQLPNFSISILYGISCSIYSKGGEQYRWSQKGHKKGHDTTSTPFFSTSTHFNELKWPQSWLISTKGPTIINDLEFDSGTLHLTKGSNWAEKSHGHTRMMNLYNEKMA